jgi:Na+-driven multidrug efflux pump
MTQYNNENKKESDIIFVLIFSIVFGILFYVSFSFFIMKFIFPLLKHLDDSKIILYWRYINASIYFLSYFVVGILFGKYLKWKGYTFWLSFITLLVVIPAVILNYVFIFLYWYPFYSVIAPIIGYILGMLVVIRKNIIN